MLTPKPADAEYRLLSPNDTAQEDIKNQIAEDEKHKTGQLIAGVSLIVFTDLFVGVPAALIIVGGGGITPPAIAAEMLETFVVLPINILGIYLIADALKQQ